VSVLVPLAPDRSAALARRNPLAKLGAALVVMLVLLATVDPVTPGVLLAVELSVLPATGVRAGTLARRTWPLLLGVAGVALANLLVVEGGRVLFELGPFDVTSAAVSAAFALSLRLLAIALPGILALATTDPMDLSDALVQRLHVSARFAYGALAALRLLPLLALEWHTIGRARRARGLDAGRSPVAAGRLFASQVFALLVAAVRRGVRLAAAMDARGFDAATTRPVARPLLRRPGDWWLLAGAGAAAVLAVSVSVATGYWDPLLG
jgi:energy-coupling factor transport system permease protein